MYSNYLTLAAGLVVVTVLGGCASPASHLAMSPTANELPIATSASHLRGLVAVRNVTGGKDTNPLWTSQVDASAFKLALQNSLASSGMAAVNPSSAKYIVDADLKALHQPLFGLTFDVESTVQYTVESAGVGQDVTVKAVGTASVSDAFAGVERLKMANERSIKENIKAFLTKFVSLAAQ